MRGVCECEMSMSGHCDKRGTDICIKWRAKETLWGTDKFVGIVRSEKQWRRHENPSLWNMLSSVLKATGLTKLWTKLITEESDERGGAYYPSTPASNALRLSSREDMPVKASIRAARASRSSSVGVTRRVASIALIWEVAPMPRTRDYDLIPGQPNLSNDSLTIEQGHW